MKDAFMMSREELLAKTGTDSEKGLTSGTGREIPQHLRHKLFCPSES